MTHKRPTAWQVAKHPASSGRWGLRVERRGLGVKEEADGVRDEGGDTLDDGAVVHYDDATVEAWRPRRRVSETIPTKADGLPDDDEGIYDGDDGDGSRLGDVGRAPTNGR